MVLQNNLFLPLMVVIFLLVRSGRTGSCEPSFRTPDCECDLTESNLALDCKDVDMSVWTPMPNLNEQLAILQKLSLKGVKNGLSKLNSILPNMTELLDLTLEKCTITELPDPDKFPKLQKIILKSSNLTNEQIGTILNPWNTSSIEKIALQNNKLTAYPQVLNKMKRLSKVNLADNEISALDASDHVMFTKPVMEIDLSNNKIKNIEHTVRFMGNFSQAILKVGGNPIVAAGNPLLRNITDLFKTVDIGTVNCNECFISKLVGDFQLIKSERIIGKCQESTVLFKELTKEKLKTCNSGASEISFTAFLLMPYVLSTLFFVKF